MQETESRPSIRRGALGQFFTPVPVAGLLASMFDPPTGEVRVLDPGAGVGSLTAALVSRAVTETWPVTLDLHAVEVDEDLIPALKETLLGCEDVSTPVTTALHTADFIEWATRQLTIGPTTAEAGLFDLAILNPPYRKLNTASPECGLLSDVGIAATNLYAAFVALTLRLLVPGGQLVAITPRSFCNGPYFKAFRREILATGSLRRIHVYESRSKAFQDAEVLQENVVLHMVKDAEQGDVIITSSSGGDDEAIRERVVAFATVVSPNDPNSFIHIVADERESAVAGNVRSLAAELGCIGASVSTGKVVDFRAREHLHMEPQVGTVPLLYPVHLRDGRVKWPASNGKKANAIAVNAETRRMFLPTGNYVLVKRFSSKEERRRVVASVLESGDLGTDELAVENHVNVFHHQGSGLPLQLAWGIATYLNSTTVDVFFRQFNGHTQVNATDLRSIRYPSVEQLRTLGHAARDGARDQMTIDMLVDRFVPELNGS